MGCPAGTSVDLRQAPFGLRQLGGLMLVRASRIVLATDFGLGAYVGQMRALLAATLAGRPVIDLIHDLPPFRPDLAAHLLAALMRDLPGGCLNLCIVDPGVGGARAARRSRWRLTHRSG